MFNVSTVLLDDALLKCVVTEVVFVFSCCFEDTPQGSAATHLRCDEILVRVLLQMFSRFWQWNKFENWSISDEVKVYKTKCAGVFGPPCTCISTDVHAVLVKIIVYVFFSFFFYFVMLCAPLDDRCLL